MISIIIPSYNQEPYLADAIESALAQTIACEVIVIDDGSTDGSLALARRYEPRVKVIAQTNRGLSAARNTGIMNATNQYILPLDADDILFDECARILFDVAQVTNADVVSPSFKTFGISHETIILMQEPKINDFLLANRVGYFSLIKKEALLEVGGYSPRMTWGWEDLHLWFNLLSRGKRIVTVPQPLVLYRTKMQSMWRDAEQHRTELWEQIFKDFPHLKSGEIVTV